MTAIRHLRLRTLVPLALVMLAAVWVAWGGFASPQTTGDDALEFAPAFHALLGGHIAGLFAHLPQDGAGGSVLLRAPFAAIGHAISPRELTVFRFGALECELALAVLGLVLVASSAPGRVLRPADWAAVALLVLAPALFGVVHLGHPEEALGAVLCVGAVLLAGSGRPGAAGALLGLAVINKPWGVLAVAPVLLAVRGGTVPRLRCAGIAGGIALAWVLAVLIAAPHPGDALAGLSAPPWPGDVWWPFTFMHPARGGVPYRALPPFLDSYGRDIGGLLALAVAIPFALRTGAGRRIEQCLALLALTFLVRCAFDPSNLLYYELPFVVATAAWEVRCGRLPLLALLASASLWLVYHPLAAPGSSLECAAYVLVTVPFAGCLAGAALRGATRVSSGAGCSPVAPQSPRRTARSAAPAAAPAP